MSSVRIAAGEAVALLTSDANPYMASFALRIDPAPLASGVEFLLDVDQRSVPLYIYKTEPRFIDHMINTFAVPWRGASSDGKSPIVS